LKVAKYDKCPPIDQSIGGGFKLRFFCANRLAVFVSVCTYSPSPDEITRLILEAAGQPG
jgi:hypothetical protein